MTAVTTIHGHASPAGGAPRRIFGSLLVAATALSALAGSHGAAGADLKHDTVRYSVRGPVRTLMVTAHVGGVQVVGGATGRVSVIVRMAFDGAVPMTRHRLAAGTLSLTSHCARGEICSVSYDISVPEATAVKVTDDVGAVRLSALTGQLSVTVAAGQITLSSISGPVDATAHAGSITGQRMSSPHASLRASAGEIDVTFAAPPSAITAITDIGAIILRVPNDVPYDVAADATGVGHVAVTVTQSTTAARTIKASTDVGSITIEP
jgi:hypothetical protein